MGDPEGTLTALHCLVCRVGARACALPIEHVREVMRPCAVERVEPAARYLLGLAVIRGEAVPVLDTGMLLTGESSAVSRFVVLRVGERRVALSMGEVVGAKLIDTDELGRLPPLLGESRDLVRGLGLLDGKLLEVLESGRLIDIASAGEEAQRPS